MNAIYEWLQQGAIGRSLISLIRVTVDLMVALISGPAVVAACLLARISSSPRPEHRPRLLFGAQPILSLSYTVSALRSAGYTAKSVVVDIYPTAEPSSFDVVLCRPSGNILGRHLLDTLGHVWYFTTSLRSFDIHHYFFDGGLLRRTMLRGLELHLLKLAGKKIVLFPYGADAFVMDELTDLSWRHALQVENYELSRKAAAIQSTIRHASRLADAVVGAIAHIDNLPRWDVLPVVWYPVDVDQFDVTLPAPSGPVRIAHAPNHRGAKGTEFLIEATRALQSEGHDIQLDLIEGVSNHESIRRIATADILVDQLLVGYALTAIEGLASGKVVVSGLDSPRYDVFRRYSYLDECPIVSASPESIEAVLRTLIDQRDTWHEIGQRSREYVEQRHSYASSIAMWEKIYDKIWFGHEVHLISLYNRHINPLPEQASEDSPPTG